MPHRRAPGDGPEWPTEPPVEPVPEEDDGAEPEHDPYAETDLVRMENPDPKRSPAAGSILGVAMLELGRIIEPAKVETEIVEMADDESDQPLPSNIDFGSLPPLD